MVRSLGYLWDLWEEGAMGVIDIGEADVAHVRKTPSNAPSYTTQ